jgi:hypothetical protein
MNNLTNTNNSPGFKGDKLDLIANIFETNTGLIFDECIKNKSFADIVIKYSDEPALVIAKRLKAFNQYGVAK